MIEAEDVKIGSWFYAVVLRQLTQAKKDSDAQITGNVRYYQLMNFKELRAKLDFIHQLQKEIPRGRNRKLIKGKHFRN